MRVCDISEEDEVTVEAVVIIRSVGAGPDTDPIAEFTLDLGSKAGKALGARDWCELGRIQPATKRSKDPKRVHAAATRASNRGTQPAPGAVTGTSSGSISGGGISADAGQPPSTTP